MRIRMALLLGAAGFGLYALLKPDTKRFSVLERGSTDHKHTVTLDDSGSGTSSYEEGHSHRVVDNTVHKADGHTHPLRVLG